MTNRRAAYLFLPIMIFLLTGCFRQASDSIEPVNESLSDQLPPAATQPQQTSATDTGVPDTEDTTPVIAVTASTPVQRATDTPQPSATPIAPPTETEDGSSITGPVEMESPEPEETFVTPISPNQSAISTATPAPTQAVEATPTDLAGPTEEIDEACIYVVQRGDTLYRIALNNDTTVDEIIAANPNVNPTLIRPDDEIVIPGCNPETASIEPTATLTTVGALGDTIHVVSAGETLGAIATQYGVTIASIIEANDLANPDRLSIGQELVIPPPESP